jgi:hypothetical protein
MDIKISAYPYVLCKPPGFGKGREGKGREGKARLGKVVQV